MKVKARDLRLADVVQLEGVEAFGTAIVAQLTEETPAAFATVKFFRPYGKTEDFSYTGGVICYIGIEHFAVERGDHEYEVVQRKTLS